MIHECLWEYLGKRCIFIQLCSQNQVQWRVWFLVERPSVPKPSLGMCLFTSPPYLKRRQCYFRSVSVDWIYLPKSQISLKSHIKSNLQPFPWARKTKFKLSQGNLHNCWYQHFYALLPLRPNAVVERGKYCLTIKVISKAVNYGLHWAPLVSNWSL